MDLLVQNVIAPDRTPFFDVLGRDYRAWVEKYVRWKDVRPELSRLEKERHVIEAAPIPLKDFQEMVFSNWNEKRRQRLSFLQNHLEGYRSPGCAIDMFDMKSFTGPMGSPMPWALPFNEQDLRDALAAMEPGLSDKERHRKLEKLDVEISRLKGELSGLEPSWRFVVSKTRIIADTWATFVSHWDNLQGLNVDKIGPRGQALGTNGPDEIWAWETLGLKANPKGRFRAGGNQ